MKLTKPFQWGGRSATPLDDTEQLLSSSQKSHTNSSLSYLHVQHHAEYSVVIHEFMKEGSPYKPVDERYIGPKCKLPIIRHRYNVYLIEN